MQEDISIYEAAKYPWSVMARSLLKQLDVPLAEVDKNLRIVDRAKQRLMDAIETQSPRPKRGIGMMHMLN